MHFCYQGYQTALSKYIVDVHRSSGSNSSLTLSHSANIETPVIGRFNSPTTTDQNKYFKEHI